MRLIVMAFGKKNVGLTYKIMRFKFFCSLIFLACAHFVSAQTDSIAKPVKPVLSADRVFKPQRAVLFRFNYVYTTPQADLQKRFTFIAQLGGSVGLKLESGWDFRAEGSFMFSRFVTETGVFDSLRSTNGFLVDRNGNNFNPEVSMRGFTFSGHIGKLFPLNRNKNSGLFVSIGAGFIQHNLHFQNLSSLSPQTSGEILKGYDRLTNGYTINQSIGYQHLSMNKLLNFYIGIDFAQGRTQFARNWNHDLMAGDTKKRIDNFWGIRLGWILPIYITNKGEDEFIFR